MAIDEVVYRATVDELKEKLNGELNPAVCNVAKAIGVHRNRLTSDPAFWNRTTGKRTRRILITQLAEYLLTKK